MPDTVKSLKLENEELKTQVNMLRKDFKNLEATLERRIAQSNDTKDAHSSISNETSKSLDFLSNGYDELSSFRREAKNEFVQLNKKLDNLTTRVDEIDKSTQNKYQDNRRIRDFSNKNLDKFRAKLLSVNWTAILNEQDPDDLYNSFLEEYSRQYEICFPLRKATSNKNNRTFTPWITKGLLTAIKKKKRLYKQFLNSSNPQQEARYKLYKNKLNHLIS